MGKTAFILSIILYTYSFFFIRNVFYTINRLIAYETDISINKLKQANLSDSEWYILNQKIKKYVLL